MNIQRDTEYRYGEFVLSPEYSNEQGTDPFADAPEGFREMMTKLGATSFDELDMEFGGNTITIHGGNGINLIIGKDFNVFYIGGGD